MNRPGLDRLALVRTGVPAADKDDGAAVHDGAGAFVAEADGASEALSPSRSASVYASRPGAPSRAARPGRR